MVETVDIRDNQKLIEWLNGQPPSVALQLAHRVATRVLPFADPDVWGYARFRGGPHERDRPRAALAAIRWNLLLQLLAYGTKPLPIERIIEFVDVAEREWISLEDIFDMTISLGLSTPLFGLVGAVLAERPDAHYTSDESHSILRAETSAHAIAQARSQAVRVRNAKGESRSDWDAAAIAEALSDIEAAQSEALRPLSLGADASGLWAKAGEVWRGRGRSWEFWIKWYEDVLAGREPDWGLLTEIAFIPDDIWEQGAEAVATEIARIEEQQRLQREVERLRSELAGARSQIAAFSARGHNNPPELVEPVAEVERQADVLAAALGEAEQELAKEAPRAAVLQRIGRELFTAASKSLAYCASLGDAALKKAAEEVGSTGAKALIGAGLIAWVSQLGAVQVLARALEAFAKMLGGS